MRNEKVSRYLIIFYLLIGIVFSILTVMTYDYLGGIRVIITAGMSIEQIGSLMFFAFMGILGLYFSIKNFRNLGITEKQKRIIGIFAVVLMLLGSFFL